MIILRQSCVFVELMFIPPYTLGTISSNLLNKVKSPRFILTSSYYSVWNFPSLAISLSTDCSYHCPSSDQPSLSFSQLTAPTTAPVLSLLPTLLFSPRLTAVPSPQGSDSESHTAPWE